MARKDPIDEAYRRGQILSAIVVQARDRAKNNPFDPKWIDCGLLGSGETKESALKIINETFDKLSEFIAYTTVLDMAGSFERASQNRIKNHIGESKKRIKATNKPDNLPVYRERLIRSTDDFTDITSVWKLLVGHAGFELNENFEAIRETRNKIAHGSFEDSLPKIDVDQTKETLKKLYEII